MRRHHTALLALAALLLMGTSHTRRVGDDPLVVVVSAASSLREMSQSQVTNIFLGRYKRLPSAERAFPADSATEKARFYRELVGKTPGEISAYWARLIYSGRTVPPEQISSPDQVIEWVEQTPGAIAYVPLAAADHRVRVVFELGKADD